MEKINAIIIALLVSIIVGAFMAFAGYQYGSTMDDAIIEDLSSRAAGSLDEAQELRKENIDLVMELNDTQEALVDQGEFFDVYADINKIPEGFARYISSTGATFLYPLTVIFEDLETGEDVEVPVRISEIKDDESTTKIQLSVTYNNEEISHDIRVTTLGVKGNVLAQVLEQMDARWGSFDECLIEVHENSAHIAKIDIANATPTGDVLSAQEFTDHARGDSKISLDHDEDGHEHENDEVKTSSFQDGSACPKPSTTTPYVATPHTNSFLFGDFGQDTFMSQSQLRTLIETVTFLP